jgi:hypothetical protein
LLQRRFDQSIELRVAQRVPPVGYTWRLAVGAFPGAGKFPGVDRVASHLRRAAIVGANGAARGEHRRRKRQQGGTKGNRHDQ